MGPHRTSGHSDRPPTVAAVARGMLGRRAPGLTGTVGGCLLVLSGGLIVAAPSVARAPLPATARPHVRAAVAFANGYLSQLACASATQCTAVAPGGTAFTFDPTRAGTVTRTQPIPHALENGTLAITCASTAACVEADAAGHVAVFAPRRATAKSASFVMTGQQYQTTVSCPTRSECVSETYTGVSVFDPAHLGSPATIAITANGAGGQPTLSCPSTSLCAGSNGTGGLIYTYRPRDAARAKVHPLTSTPQIGSLDCPSKAFCVALASPRASAGVNLGYIAFNPTGPGNPRVRKLTDSSLEFLTCASATLCAAAGNNGGVFTFDPRGSSRAHLTLVPSADDLAGIAFAGPTLVLLSDTGEKAVIDPSAPPKTVALAQLSKAARVYRG